MPVTLDYGVRHEVEDTSWAGEGQMPGAWTLGFAGQTASVVYLPAAACASAESTVTLTAIDGPSYPEGADVVVRLAVSTSSPVPCGGPTLPGQPGDNFPVVDVQSKSGAFVYAPGCTAASTCVSTESPQPFVDLLRSGKPETANYQWTPASYQEAGAFHTAPPGQYTWTAAFAGHRATSVFYYGAAQGSAARGG